MRSLPLLSLVLSLSRELCRHTEMLRCRQVSAGHVLLSYCIIKFILSVLDILIEFGFLIEFGCLCQFFRLLQRHEL